MLLKLLGPWARTFARMRLSSNFYWFTLRALLLLSLTGLGLSQSSAATRNPYNQKLDDLAARWNLANNSEKAVLLQNAFDLREFVDTPSSINQILLHASIDEQLSPLVRAEANWLLSQLDIKTAKLGDAQSKIANLGFIRNWTMAGPVSSNAGLDAKLAGMLPWKKLEAGSPYSWVELRDYAGTFTQVTAVLATNISVSESQRVALRFSSDAAVAVYVNGDRIFTDGHESVSGFDQYSAGAILHAGSNSVMVKLARTGSDRWRFAFRITSPSGNGIAFKSSTDSIPSLNTIRFAAAAKTVEVSNLLAEATEEVKRDQTSASKLDVIGLLEQQRGLPGAKDHLELAALKTPSASRWLALASACQDAHCTESALNAASAIAADDTSVKIALATYYQGRNQHLKARDLLEQVAAHDSTQFVARKEIADLYFSSGSKSRALSEYRALRSEFPNTLWLERELALSLEKATLIDPAIELAEAALEQNFDGIDERAALQRMYELRRDTAKLAVLAQQKTRLSPVCEEITGAEVITDSTSDTFAYLENAAALAKQFHKNPPTDDANTILLADINVERVGANSLSTMQVQQVYYLNSDRAVRDFASRSIQYSSENQQLTVLAAKVYKADGRTSDAEDGGENRIADVDISMYYDTRARVLRFPHLKKGDVVELSYRLSPTKDANPYGDYFGSLMVFQSGLPERLRRYVLISPASGNLNIVEQKMQAKARISASDDTITRVWEARDVSPLPMEPRGPSLTETAPYVNVSSFGSWNEFGRWYANLISPQFALNQPLRDELQRTISGKSAELDRIRAIHEFVLKNTRYLAMEFGVFSYKPYPVSETFARRFGDCKDKASLMIALLRATGVDAEIALVRTRKLGDVSDQAISLSVFNHAVVYVPKYNLWLDGTAEYAGFRELPLDDQGAMALTVSLDGDAQMRRIPITLPMENFTHRVVRARLQTDGKIEFSGSAYTRGEDAPGLRKDFESLDRQRDSVRNSLAEVYPSVHVEDVSVDGATDLERDINVEFKGSLTSFAGRKTFSLVPSWMKHSYVQRLATLQSRTQDLTLPAPWTTQEELHFVLPDGASFESIPQNVQIDTPFGFANIKFHRQDRELSIVTSVQFRKIRISSEEYEAFRNFCQDVEQAFRSEIKVRLAGS